MDLNTDMRRKTRAGRSAHWRTALGGKPPLNSNKLHIAFNPKIATSTSKTESDFTKGSEIRLKSRNIYPRKGFAKNVDAGAGRQHDW